MMTFEEMLKAAMAELPAVRSRKEYAAFCKEAVFFAKNWTKNGRLNIQYVMKTCHGDMLNSDTIHGQKRPIAMGMVLVGPDGEMYAGGSSQNPRDTWNRYIGQWHAIKRAQKVPDNITLASYEYYVVKGDAIQIGWMSATAGGRVDLPNDLQFFNTRLPSGIYAFPLRARRAIIRCIGAVMFHRHQIDAESAARAESDKCDACDCTCKDLK
jgi:hypothetical protein